MELAGFVVANDAIAVLAPALGEVTRDPLPLPQIGIHQPVHELGNFPLDLLRGVGYDLLLEALLDAAAVQEVHHSPDPHRLVEVVVAAPLHLEQDAIDVRHAELEIASEVLLVDRRVDAPLRPGS